MKEENERDFLRLGEDFYIAFLYGDVLDESEFLRTARSVWLEFKCDNVEEMRRKILESSLVKKLDMPEPIFIFRHPGGSAGDWSVSTRTYHFMKEPEKAQIWQRSKRPSSRRQ